MNTFKHHMKITTTVQLSLIVLQSVAKMAILSTVHI